MRARLGGRTAARESAGRRAPVPRGRDGIRPRHPPPFSSLGSSWRASLDSVTLSLAPPVPLAGAALRVFPALRALDLTCGRPVDAGDCEALAGAASLTSVSGLLPGGRTADEAAAALASAPRLLALAGAASLTDAGLAALGDAAPALTSLAVEGGVLISDAGVAAVAARARALTVLAVPLPPLPRPCAALGDAALLSMATLPLLARVNLTGWARASPAGVRALAAACPLTHLTLAATDAACDAGVLAAVQGAGATLVSLVVDAPADGRLTAAALGAAARSAPGLLTLALRGADWAAGLDARGRPTMGGRGPAAGAWLPALASLDVSRAARCRHPARPAAPPLELLAMTAVTHLTAVATPLGSAGAAAALGRARRLAALDARAAPGFGPAQLVALSSASLTRLDLRGCEGLEAATAGEWATALASSRSTLASLSLTAASPNSAALAFVGCFSDDDASVAPGRALAALGRGAALDRVVLRGGALTAATAAAVGRLPSLTSLDVAGCSSMPGDAPCLASLLAAALAAGGSGGRLTSLSLAHTDAGGAALAALLARTPSLATLNVAGTSFDDSDAPSLALCPALTSLRVGDVPPGGGLGDAGLARLPAAAPGLVDLNLRGGCHAAPAALTALTSLPRLARLDLGGAAGLDGGRALRALAGCTALRRLRLAPAGSDVGVSPTMLPAARPRAADAAALRASSPRLATLDLGGVKLSGSGEALAAAARVAALGALLDALWAAVAAGDAIATAWRRVRKGGWTAKGGAAAACG